MPSLVNHIVSTHPSFVRTNYTFTLDPGDLRSNNSNGDMAMLAFIVPCFVGCILYLFDAGRKAIQARREFRRQNDAATTGEIQQTAH